MHPRSRLTGLAAVALLSGAGAQAQAQAQAQTQTPDGVYPYVGIDIGQARARIDDLRLSDEALDGSGLGITSTSRAERDASYRLFGGAQFNRYIGIEAGYFRLGTFSYQATTSPAGQLNADLKVRGLSLDLVGSLPFSNRLSGLLRAGYQSARTYAEMMGSGAVIIANGSTRLIDSAPRFGVGLQYAFGPHMLLRAEAESSRFADGLGGTARASVYSLSLVMPFGGARASARKSAYAAPEPQRLRDDSMPSAVAFDIPPSIVALAPAPAPLNRARFAAESMFDFDSARLRPLGKTALENLTGEPVGASSVGISIIGHADRIGTAVYNQTLSLKRAQAVKANFINSDGLNPACINTEGRSESEPVTQPGDCKGPESARLITCLQPDRRVEIEVSGTRQ